jgi:PhnB protein
MAAQPIPAGYHTITPYLIIKGAARALEFYKKAFAAKEHFRMADPAGMVGHAEIQIGDSMLMLADEHPQMGYKGPASPGATPVSIHLYVDNVDAWAERAIAAGATVTRPVQDQFYGDRSGTFIDPFGHVWTISTHKEDIDPAELGRRAKAAMNSKQQG